jgi:hypothetical protein
MVEVWNTFIKNPENEEEKPSEVEGPYSIIDDAPNSQHGQTRETSSEKLK